MPTNLEERQRKPRQKVDAHEIKSAYAWVIEDIFP